MSNWWDTSQRPDFGDQPLAVAPVHPEGDSVYEPDGGLSVFADLGLKLDLANRHLKRIGDGQREARAQVEGTTRIPLKASGQGTSGLVALNAVVLGGPDEGYKFLVRSVSAMPATATPSSNFGTSELGVYVGTPMGGQSTNSTFGVNPGDLVDSYGVSSSQGVLGLARQYSNEQVEVDYGQKLYVAVQLSAGTDAYVATAYVLQVPTATRTKGVRDL